MVHGAVNNDTVIMDMGLMRHFASQQSHRSWVLKEERDLIVIFTMNVSIFKSFPDLFIICICVKELATICP